MTSASQLTSTNIIESRARMFAPTPISLIGLVDTAHDGHTLSWSIFSAGGGWELDDVPAVRDPAELSPQTFGTLRRECSRSTARAMHWQPLTRFV